VCLLARHVGPTQGGVRELGGLPVALDQLALDGIGRFVGVRDAE